MKHKFVEYQRQCTRDGYVWYVPEELHDEPKKPNPFERLAASGERMQSAGGRRGSSGAHSARVAGMEMARATMLTPYLQARQCPACGSGAFTERRITGRR